MAAQPDIDVGRQGTAASTRAGANWTDDDASETIITIIACVELGWYP